MSGTEYTTTPNLGLIKPTYNADAENWGFHINSNSDVLDAVLEGGGPFLPLAGGTVQASGDAYGLALSSGAYGGNIGGTGVDGDINLLPTGNGKVFLGINHHYTGSAGTASWLNIDATGTITDSSTAQTVLCAITDSVDASGAQGGGLSVVRHGYNLAAGAVGGRTAFGADFTQTGATTLAAGLYYVGGAFFVSAAYSAGGVTGAGNARGNMFASNDSAILRAGAGLYWNSLVGYELDVGAEAGTGLGYKQGMKIVTWASDRVAGSGAADYAYGIAAQAACAGWDVGYCIGSPDGWWPMKSTSRLIGTAPALAGGPTYAAAWGVDFLAISFSGGLIRGPGFSVDGAGGVTIGNGAHFGSQTVTGRNDLTKHLDLYGGSYGFNMLSSGHMNLAILGGGALEISVDTGFIGAIDSTGLNYMPIGAVGAASGKFSTVGFQGTAPISKPTVTGAKGGNAALASLLTALSAYGLVTDSST